MKHILLWTSTKIIDFKEKSDEYILGYQTLYYSLLSKNIVYENMSKIIFAFKGSNDYSVSWHAF